MKKTMKAKPRKTRRFSGHLKFFQISKLSSLKNAGIFKKAQGLSINTLIIAIIALIVLAIVIYVFRDQIARIVSSFTSIGTEAGKQAENATTALGEIYG